MPADGCSAAFLRAAESLETTVEHTCLDELGLNPETRATFLAFQVVVVFHLLQPRPEPWGIGAVYQPVEGVDALAASDEELNSARVARNVRFVLLADADLAGNSTYRAWEHLFVAQGSHPPEESSYQE
jgi:hypothetical protein